MYSTRIYYQDTDAGGVVYFANYLRFFEKSWFDYLMALGISIPEWEARDTFMIVKNAQLDLVSKLRYGDSILVHTVVAEVKNAFFVLSHEVVRDGTVTARGRTTMVCINGLGRPKRIPEELKTRLVAASLPASP